LIFSFESCPFDNNISSIGNPDWRLNFMSFFITFYKNTWLDRRFAEKIWLFWFSYVSMNRFSICCRVFFISFQRSRSETFLSIFRDFSLIIGRNVFVLSSCSAVEIVFAKNESVLFFILFVKLLL
jgi:hypothetical protein